VSAEVSDAIYLRSKRIRAAAENQKANETDDAKRALIDVAANETIRLLTIGIQNATAEEMRRANKTVTFEMPRAASLDKPSGGDETARPLCDKPSGGDETARPLCDKLRETARKCEVVASLDKPSGSGEAARPPCGADTSSSAQCMKRPRHEVEPVAITESKRSRTDEIPKRVPFFTREQIESREDLLRPDPTDTLPPASSASDRFATRRGPRLCSARLYETNFHAPRAPSRPEPFRRASRRNAGMTELVIDLDNEEGASRQLNVTFNLGPKPSGA
jgi:hypothetical protein